MDLRKGGLLSSTLLLPFRFVVALPLVTSELLEFTRADWEDLQARGLAIVDLNGNQVRRALELKTAHAALSPNDCFSLALAIANTGAILLTGDRQLRQRATSLGVEVHGILWVADQIERRGTLSLSALVDALERWAIDPLVFVPKKELAAMIERMRNRLSGPESPDKGAPSDPRSTSALRLRGEMMTLTGGCFCGRVRYRITAPLGGGRSCHCSRCRKAFSGTGSAYAEVTPGSFSWVDGEENLSQYESTPGWGLCFCKTCGTTLCGMHQGEVHGVTLGTVDGDPGVQIEMHIFVGSKAPWDHIGGNAPQHLEFPPAAGSTT